MDVIRLVLLVRLGLEAGRMDIGASARPYDAVDGVGQRGELGGLRRSRKHQRQRTRHVGDSAKVAFSDHLGCETIFDAMGIPDHTDHGPSHLLISAFIVLRKDSSGLKRDSGGSCLRHGAGST